eukprot:3202511-Heterocapsa_arctica.AAC.1
MMTNDKMHTLWEDENGKFELYQVGDVILLYIWPLAKQPCGKDFVLGRRVVFNCHSAMTILSARVDRRVDQSRPPRRSPRMKR